MIVGGRPIECIGVLFLPLIEKIARQDLEWEKCNISKACKIFIQAFPTQGAQIFKN
jgi:hypothetical protein